MASAEVITHHHTSLVYREILHPENGYNLHSLKILSLLISQKSVYSTRFFMDSGSSVMNEVVYKKMANSIYTTLPYRRGVGIMVLNKDKQAFVGKRIDTKSNSWQMPQGGIDDDETVKEAGIREIFEETNIKNIEILCETEKWIYYDLPEFLIGRLWSGKYRGQKQKWILARFTGQDDEINIEKSNQEFRQWRWTSVESLADIVIHFKRHLYLSVIKEFSPIIKKL